MDKQQFRQLILTIKHAAFLIAGCIILGFFSQRDPSAGVLAVILLLSYFWF